VDDHTVLDFQLWELPSDPLLERYRMFISNAQNRWKANLADDLCQRGTLEANIFSWWEM